MISLSPFLSVFGLGALVQTMAMWNYWRSYRKVVSTVSRFETVVVVPAAMPLLFMLLWVVRVFDYASEHGWQQSLAWLWWEPIVALVVFAGGSAFSQWYRARLLDRST